MKKFIALALALVMSLSLVACGAPAAGSASASQPEAQATDLEAIKAKGEMIIGYTVYEPMNYTDENGVFTGFDTELAQAVCAKLGVTPKFQEIVWETKEVELNAGTIDCVWNGMTITEERQANMEITDPYVINAQVVVMKADVIGNYADTASMNGLTIAVENGSAGQSAAEAIAGATVIPLQDQGAALLEVKAGTADACVIDITMAYAMTGEGTDYTDLAPGISLTEEFYGVSFRKDSDMTAKLNDFIAKLRTDGTLQALADKYNLTLAE